jgi:hypothetical protein
MATCKHCGNPIKHYSGRLWHCSSVVFPQYCRTTASNLGSQLHEPSEPITQGRIYTIDEILSLGDIGDLR